MDPGMFNNPELMAQMQEMMKDPDMMKNMMNMMGGMGGMPGMPDMSEMGNMGGMPDMSEMGNMGSVEEDCSTNLRFKPGDSVLIQSLKNDMYNGKEAVIESYNRESDRYVINIEEMEKRISVREINLDNLSTEENKNDDTEETNGHVDDVDIDSIKIE